jgi:hypothetical protein
MNNYKSWSGDFRKKSLKLTQRAQRLGWIPYPKKCNRCGQTQGIIHTHNEDYDVTYYTLQRAFDRFPISITPEELQKLNSVLEPLCWTCHMMHHSKHRNASAVERYENAVKNGHQYPPVYKHNFGILRKYGV